jgi:hypothetical protein
MSPIPLGILAGQGFAFIGAAYFVGGFNGAYVSTVDKMLFGVETRTTLGTGLPVAIGLMASTSNSGVAGYAGGGEPYPKSAIYKFSFANDSRSTLAATMSGGGYSADGSGFSNKGVAGYMHHGGGGTSRNIDKLLFSNETRTTFSGTVRETQGNAGFENNGVAGYMASGATSDNPQPQDVAKFAFPSDTRSILVATRSQTGGWVAGMSNSGVAGYVSGGLDFVTSRDYIDKFTYSTDTRSSLSLGYAANSMAGVNCTAVAGYFGGGSSSSNKGAAYSNIRKVTFATDTVSNAASSLSAIRSRLVGLSNSL